MTAAQITRAMVAKGITRAELAERLEVSVETVRSWTYGRRSPCCRHMEAALRRALNQPTSDCARRKASK